MGYYVEIINANYIIPARNLDAAFEALKALNKLPDDEKRGGSWQGGKRVSSWFSWMDADYDQTCLDARHILEELGFETYFEDSGDLRITGYDSKTGQEDLFLAALAPFAVPGSFLIWRGEDGEDWTTIVPKSSDPVEGGEYTAVRIDPKELTE